MKTLLTFVAAILISITAQAQTPSKNQSMNKDFLEIAAERYSVRKFSSKKVEKEKTDKILEAGKLAPTAVNSQPQKIYVLQSEEAVKKANEISPCIYGAPQVFLICYDDNKACKRDNDNYGDVDCTIVLTHMMLEAWNLGVGTCMVGKFDPADAVKAFNLPANIHPVLLMPFGYAASDSKPSPKHSTFRPMEEMVEYK